MAENVPSIAPVNRKTVKIDRAPEIPDYEKMYEPKHEEFTFESAAMIEESSWDVTEKLVSAFEESEIIEPVTVNIGVSDASDAAPTALPQKNGVADDFIKGLRYILNGDQSGFVKLARSKGLLPDAFVDKINELLLDEIGDIGVESDGVTYNIAQWYVDDIKEIIKSRG